MKIDHVLDFEDSIFNYAGDIDDLIIKESDGVYDYDSEGLMLYAQRQAADNIGKDLLPEFTKLWKGVFNGYNITEIIDDRKELKNIIEEASEVNETPEDYFAESCTFDTAWIEIMDPKFIYAGENAYINSEIFNKLVDARYKTALLEIEDTISDCEEYDDYKDDIRRGLM